MGVGSSTVELVLCRDLDCQPTPSAREFTVAPSTINAVRIVWREVGLDTQRGISPGPIRYQVELETAEGQWKTILDRSQSQEDLMTDYRECVPAVGNRARLVVLDWPKGMVPAVSEFTVFGNTK